MFSSVKQKTFLLTLIVFYFQPHTFGQTNKLAKADKELTALYSKIFPFYYGNNDSLNYYSELFSTSLIDFIEKKPATLNYQFKSLIDSNVCSIVTSLDGLFRIYSWDTWLGGTMHDFNNIFQFKSGKNVYTTDFNENEDEYGNYFTDIFSLKTSSKTYYLAIGGGTYSTKDVYETLSVYSIDNDSLKDDVKLIKTTEGFTNSISIEYDFFSVADRPERPVKLIKYDSDKKIIYIPIVLDNGKVTKRYIQYKFNGRYFEKVLLPKK